MTSVQFKHVPHPRIAQRLRGRAPAAAAEHVGVNGQIAMRVTAIVGTMWCAYAFALIAILGLPEAAGGGALAFVDWLSQTFIQLVMLSVIMVGQNILGRAADKRAQMTWDDAEATLHEMQQLQAHLRAQDEAINALIAKVDSLQASPGPSGPTGTSGTPGPSGPPTPYTPFRHTGQA